MQVPNLSEMAYGKCWRCGYGLFWGEPYVPLRMTLSNKTVVVYYCPRCAYKHHPRVDRAEWRRQGIR